MHIASSSIVHSINIVYDEQAGNLSFSDVEEQRRPPCRAHRLVGNSRRFLLVKVPRHLPKEHSQDLHHFLELTRKDGIYYPFDQQQVKFSFLGCTESGIKSGHLIYFTAGDDMNVSSLLKQLGQLDEVFKYSGAGKYAARLGLSFTSTMKAIDVSDDETKLIDDVFAEDGNYTSDGCSPIRESYAKVIRNKLDLPSSTSVFHIRRGGMKGLLVAYPDEIFDVLWGNTMETVSGTSRIHECVFAYRPSMLKYRGGPTEIEVHGYSEPMDSARLNFQFIVLLLYLGVEIEAFGELLKAHLHEIAALTSDRQLAIRCLKGELDGQRQGSYQDLVEMLYAGHSMDEKYLHRHLCLFQNRQYAKLKEKLNINVPRSCYAYGVIDELGVLGDGEVYINLPYREGPIVSDVLVARNPACKPEDIRRLKAVYKPELCFLRNCIVFPLHSRYSIPNSLSGGDLDGDKYFVCWEPTILPPRTEIPPIAALHRSPIQPPRRSVPNDSTNLTEVEVEKINMNIQKSLLDVFLEQHYGMVLGMASNDWKRLAEHYDDPTTWDYCLDLAEIVKEALDLTKSGGNYRALDRRLTVLKTEYSRRREEERRATLDKPLDFLRSLIPSFNRTQNPEYEVDPDLNLERLDKRKWTEFYDEGIDVMKKFNGQLSKAIAADAKDKETPTLFPREKDGFSSHSDLVKEAFMNEYFPKSPGFLCPANIDSFLRASAWYVVGYRSNKPAFAWMGARYLNHIKAYETCGGRPGFVIGALTQINGPGTDALSANCETRNNTPGSSLHERLGNLRIQV